MVYLNWIGYLIFVLILNYWKCLDIFIVYKLQYWFQNENLDFGSLWYTHTKPNHMDDYIFKAQQQSMVNCLLSGGVYIQSFEFHALDIQLRDLAIKHLKYWFQISSILERTKNSTKISNVSFQRSDSGLFNPEYWGRSILIGLPRPLFMIY